MGRGRLVAGHGRGAVVQNRQDEAGSLSHRIHQRRDTGMKKGGIPHRGDNILLLPRDPVRLIKTRRLTNRRPHAENRIHPPQIETQGIATDIRGVDPLGSGLLDGVKAGPVGAAGAEGRAAPPSHGRGKLCRNRETGKLRQKPLDYFREQLSRFGNRAGKLPFDPGAVTQLHLNDPGRLFQHQHLVMGAKNLLHERSMKRIGLNHLIQRQLIPEAQIPQSLAGVGGGDTGGDDPLLPPEAGVKPMRRGGAPGRNLQELFVQLQVQPVTVNRGSGPTAGLLAKIGDPVEPLHRTGNHILTGMANPGGGAEHHGEPERLGKFESFPGQLSGLRR